SPRRSVNSMGVPTCDSKPNAWAAVVAHATKNGRERCNTSANISRLATRASISGPGVPVLQAAPMSELEDILDQALAQRKPLVAALHPDTDCYRLFHGATEGWPGLAVDRYGPQLLVQTWQALLTEAQLDAI